MVHHLGFKVQFLTSRVALRVKKCPTPHTPVPGLPAPPWHRPYLFPGMPPLWASPELDATLRTPGATCHVSQAVSEHFSCGPTDCTSTSNCSGLQGEHPRCPRAGKEVADLYGVLDLAFTSPCQHQNNSGIRQELLLVLFQEY